ncbi:MAG: hypothetical protein OXU20_05105 [Myxococcales bacterium]|nr:hypothetical protein [Myxococcales bacterium]MDD9971327.1 hypothetical protein [Myxococcales bacterium]
MTENKSTGNVLEDVSRVGSKLASFASEQLETVLRELGGPAAAQGAGAPPMSTTASVGSHPDARTLSTQALQLIGKAGALMTELAQYEVVRRGRPQVTLRSANRFASMTVPEGSTSDYTFLLANGGEDEPCLVLSAALSGSDGAPGALKLRPEKTRLHCGERRQVQIQLPALAEGEYVLELRVRTEHSKLLAAQNVAVRVLPSAKPHAS